MIPSTLKTLLLLSFALILYLLLHVPPPYLPQSLLSTPHEAAPLPTSSHHLLFSIASSAGSLGRRAPYLRLWSNSARAILFLDSPPPPDPSFVAALPPIVLSGDTSRFPYTFRRGLPSAVRVARIVKEAVDRNESDIRWFVFGDDDTVFFVDNLVRTLSKYDHDQWFYVGSSSESYEQNESNSFDMAFGGGGFVLSHSLARALAGVFDSCLMRYPHLFGSDARIFSCLAELGVGLTHEPGFHQVDIRGNLFGMLSAHPLSPLVSLHHLDSVDPIFPNRNRTQALEHLFEAVNFDPARILQQTICYDRLSSLTISVAWGFSIQVFEGNLLLPDLLPLQRTFTPWRRGRNISLSRYMFNTREYPKDPCKRPVVFFLQSVGSNHDGVWSNYTRHAVGNCGQTGAIKNLEHIRVLSQKLELNIEQILQSRLCRELECRAYHRGSNSLRHEVQSIGQVWKKEVALKMSKKTGFKVMAKGNYPGSLLSAKVFGEELGLLFCLIKTHTNGPVTG